jgi:S-adenosylmethionine:tRNA ribosyltransferase-isomerase
MTVTGPTVTGPTVAGPTSFALTGFVLPAEREAHDPPEARGVPRDGVRLLASRRGSGQISQHTFRDLPGLLLPGDLLVVNTSGTLPAQVRAGRELAVHFCSPRPDGSWLVELREVKDKISRPNGQGCAGQVIDLPGGAALTLLSRAGARLWRARMPVAVVPYLFRHGVPIRYSHVRRDWPLAAYQTVFARTPGSAEMPSAGRPFTPAVITELVARGVLIAPLTLHAGVSSLEEGEDPYPEPYDVPPATAALVNHVRAHGGRVIAAGTTVVRALETAAGPDGRVSAAAGWTSHVVTPETGVRAVHGLLTGLHEPRSSHLRMLAAFAGADLLSRCYATAISAGYLWHEFGDVHLLLP